MLGTRLREKRTEIGMSIKELAQKTGLTSGFISQVERGIAEPSITSLRNIAKVLGVAVFYFLLDDIDVNPVVRKNEGKILKFYKSNLTFELLSPDLNRQMELFMAKIKPDQAISEEATFHSGEEAIHVLKGTMRINIGEDEYILEEGDSIHFNSSKPHKIINTGETELQYISAATPTPKFDSLSLKQKRNKRLLEVTSS